MILFKVLKDGRIAFLTGEPDQLSPKNFCFKAAVNFSSIVSPDVA